MIGDCEPSATVDERGVAVDLHAFWAVVLLLFCVWALFWNLGRVGLFEPDEGRSAEIAREILLLKDWITPHYDFLPRLDKPILFFDLVALSFKLFGISEWSARLPSALAALGCLLLTYRLSLTLFGRPAALWSSLILMTTVEFFAFSRIVILDMLLTFFLTLGLACFFWGQQAAERGEGRAPFLCMYCAFGAATLTKGPIGFVLPAMIIALYIALLRRWTLPRRMQPAWGIPLFLVTATSWYLLAESHNPGYLRYFLMQENFARFTTTAFHRTQPWYFYLLVLPIGFFPWTVLLPSAIADLWKRPRRREQLFLALWVVLPLLFFSMSRAKLIHYILPVFPPLAIIAGASLARAFHERREKIARAAAFPGVVFLLLAMILLVALRWPQIFPPEFQGELSAGSLQIPLFAVAGILVFLGVVAAVERSRLWRNPPTIYCATIATFTLVVLLSPLVTLPVANHRSSRVLADQAAPFIGASDRLVLYSGYPSSLPFYLHIQRPMWIVRPADKRQVLGSSYLAHQQPLPAPGYGQVLYTPEEFARLWRHSDQRMLVFIDRGTIGRFKLLVGSPLRVLARSREMVLIENVAARRRPADDD